MRNLAWTYRSLDKLQDAEELEALLRDEEMCYKESKLHWVSQSTSLAAVEADFEYLEQCQKKYGRDFKVPRISIYLSPQLVKMVRVQREEREDAVLDSDWVNAGSKRYNQEKRHHIVYGPRIGGRKPLMKRTRALGWSGFEAESHCWSRRWRTIMRQEGIPSDGRDNYTEEEIRVKSDEYGTCVRFGQLREIRDTNQSSREFHNLAERFSWRADGNQRNFPASSLEDSIGETRTTAETDGEKPGEEKNQSNAIFREYRYSDGLKWSARRSMVTASDEIESIQPCRSLERGKEPLIEASAEAPKTGEEEWRRMEETSQGDCNGTIEDWQ
ncbi:hypothetical protein K438DRAFT_1776006 [Mycena galopus ATCC 62051]|nr:hypothetical protein K438DRAFT_1776006 [Mycena galopus ATCC 62051]